MSVLTVENIKKNFGSVEVLRGVSFSIEKGEIFGFLGRNGAGKSTLINILAGVMHATSGEFSVLGNTINVSKSKMGVFPDVDGFYNDWNAIQHLRFFAKVKKVPLNNKDIEEKLALVGLAPHKKKKVKHYSFGMKKKLGIAQALLGNPAFIILDEPTSGLDPESAIQIRELIKRYVKKGNTIFITSHNLNELEQISHRIAILKDGLISACGTMAELRMRYQSEIEVVIKLNQPLTQSVKGAIIIPYKTEGCDLSIFVTHKQQIADCIKQLVLAGYDIYEMVQHEQTLEAIFLQNEVTNIWGK